MRAAFLCLIFGALAYAQLPVPSSPRTAVSGTMVDITCQPFAGTVTVSLTDSTYYFSRRVDVSSGGISLSLYPGTYTVTLTSSATGIPRVETWNVPNSTAAQSFSNVQVGPGAITCPGQRAITEFYPNGFPAVTAATPTIADCTTLVNNLAPLLAKAVIEKSTVLRNSFRATFSGVAEASTVAIGGGTAAISPLTTATEAVQVDVMNANPQLTADLATRLGVVTARLVDTSLVSIWAGFTANASQGGGGSPITETVLNAAITAIGGTGEPVFLAIAIADYNTFIARTTATDAGTSDVTGATYYKGMRLLPTVGIISNGSGPATIENIAFTPSAFGAGSLVQPLTNDATHAQATSTYQNFTLNIAITNTGTGVQTVTVRVVFAPVIATNARGVVVRS